MSSNTELLERRQKAVARGVYSATPIFAERAKNAELWDADGKRYIDFAVGIAVCNTGHCHPKIMAAAKAQCDLFTHTAFQVSAYESGIRCFFDDDFSRQRTSLRLEVIAGLAGAIG